MIFAVIFCNLMIALVCLGVVRKLLGLRKTLAAVSRKVLAWEQGSYNVLHRSPEAILKGQRGLQQAKAQYEKLQPQIERAEQLLSLGGAVVSYWRQFSRKSRRSSRSPRRRSANLERKQ